jgi:hypothetical protein
MLHGEAGRRSPLPGRLLAAAAWTLLAGCAAQPEGSGAILDPTQARVDLGTLVDMSDVLEVSQRMVNSLRADPGVAGLLKESRPVRIALDPRQIKNLTSMVGFSKRLLVNQMLATLNRTAGDDFRFLDREATAAERARQLSGEVKSAGAEEAPAGAELVLSGRILEKLDRRPAAGGALEETRSVQFAFSLVRVKDAVTLWNDAFFRVKQQTIGTVYN